MKKSIFLIISASIILLIGIGNLLAMEKTYYKIGITYDKGNLSIDSLDIDFYNKDLKNSFGAYSIGLYNTNNKLIEKIYFNVPNSVLVESIGNNSGFSRNKEIRLDHVSFETYIPYYDDLDNIRIYGPDSKEIIRKDVSMYSREKIITSDKKNDIEKNKVESGVSNEPENKNYWWVFVLLIAIIFVITIIFFIIKRKK